MDMLRSDSPAPPGLRPAVFLDRDGTVIWDVHYPRDPEAVELVPGAAKALRELQTAGFALVVVSNQSGIGRGWVTEDEAAQVHDRVVETLAAHGVRLDGAYYCPHTPDAGCACRKPAPGLLEQAASELGLDLERSVMIGDKGSDVEAGRQAGCRTVLFQATPPEGLTSGVPASGVPASGGAASTWAEALAMVLGESTPVG